MLARTSSEAAPWQVIPANDKRFARITALRHIVRTLSDGIEIAPVVPDRQVLDEADRILDLDPALIASLRGRTE